MTENETKKMLQDRGMCGSISDDDGNCTRTACILSRHHDNGLHEPPAMLTVTRLLIERANAALESFISGPLSELSEGRPFSPSEQDAWNKAMFARDALRAQL